jgi:hypothetical protein
LDADHKKANEKALKNATVLKLAVNTSWAQVGACGKREGGGEKEAWERQLGGWVGAWGEVGVACAYNAEAAG